MITIPELLKKKARREKIVMLTAYDYPLANLVEQAGVDMILVGDSGGMVQYGYASTIPVTMDEMVMMVKAVRRGAPATFTIADLPFLSYQVSRAQAIRNAGRLIKEGGADAVKLEGGVRMADTVRAVVDAGIAVQGHIGLTPQNAVQLGGFRVQGKTHHAARALIEDALALESAGIFSLILEAIPVKLANYITARIAVPTIGTGSGSGCDGQNLITPDLLGYYGVFRPKYVKRYADLNAIIGEALQRYKAEVSASLFPAEEHTYPLGDDAFLEQLFASLDGEDAIVESADDAVLTVPGAR
jgi:3-methyl-2-oxobutanoate hydroxymethyltransferase